MELTDDQIKEIEELASLFCSIEEISLLIDVPEGELRRAIRDRNSIISKRYHKGKLTTQVTLRRQTKTFAEKGSPQAEQTMHKLYERQVNNE